MVILERRPETVFIDAPRGKFAMMDMQQRALLDERMRASGRSFITLEDLESLGPLPGTEKCYRSGDMMTRVVMVTASEMNHPFWALIADQARASYEMWGKEVTEKISQPDHCDGVDQNGNVVEGPYQNTIHFVSEAFFIDPSSNVFVSGQPVRVNDEGVPIIKAVSKRAMNIDPRYVDLLRSGVLPYPEEIGIWNVKRADGSQVSMMQALHEALVLKYGSDVLPEELYTASGRAGTYPFSRRRSKEEAVLSAFAYAAIQEAMCTRPDARPVIVGMLNTEMRDSAFAWRRPEGSKLVIDYSPGVEMLQRWGMDITETTLNRRDPRVQDYLLSATGYWADNKELGNALIRHADRFSGAEMLALRMIAGKIMDENHLRGGERDHELLAGFMNGTASRAEINEILMAMSSSRLARRMEPLIAMSPLVQQIILEEGGDGPYWFAQERGPFCESAVRILYAVEEDRGTGLSVAQQQ